jgi:glycosyltransferase involved in cell wall biosynthesis
LKILQIISGRNVNGAITYCKFISEQFVSRGHDVTVICRPDGWLQEHLAPPIEIVESEQNRSLTELKRIAKWIRENNIDVIHTHMSRGHAFGVLLKMMTGIPVIATAHSCSFQLHWRMNNFVIANSQATFDYHRRVNRIPARKLGKVFCFTDLERFKHVTPLAIATVRGQLRLKGDEFVLGLVGEVVERKGHLYLFQALRQIIDAIPNFKLVMLGRFRRSEAYVKRLRAIQLKQNLHRCVKWLGLRSNVQDFMATFDLTVVPSIEEPLGLVALESLAAGTPVVAARTGGLPEIVRHGENGLLVPPKNPDELARAIIKLARSAEERKRLGETGRDMIHQEFDPVSLTLEVEKIFETVVANSRPRQAAGRKIAQPGRISRVDSKPPTRHAG